jgi:hypothetical protein
VDRLESTTPEAEDTRKAEPQSDPGAMRRGVGRVLRAVRERPAVAIGAAGLAMLVVVWIVWAIHVGSTNGGRAAVGVLITWPLLFLVAASLALIGLGMVRMARRLQPSETGSKEAEENDSQPG